WGRGGSSGGGSGSAASRTAAPCRPAPSSWGRPSGRNETSCATPAARRGPAGGRRGGGGWGGPSRAPPRRSMSTRMIEERHGFPGALRASAGGVRGGRSPLRLKRLGGHLGAPHDDR